jgi:hypothetical protein
MFRQQRYRTPRAGGNTVSALRAFIFIYYRFGSVHLASIFINTISLAALLV